MLICKDYAIAYFFFTKQANIAKHAKEIKNYKSTKENDDYFKIKFLIMKKENKNKTNANNLNLSAFKTINH